MRTRCHFLAVVLVLAGHGVGVVGLPMPSSRVAVQASRLQSASGTPAPQKKKCCCACGDDCGPCCCCSGGAEPAEPPVSESWTWVASVQVQKCFGIGPAGFTELPPALPAVKSPGHFLSDPVVNIVRHRAIIAIVVAMRPPTPPPRLV